MKYIIGILIAMFIYCILTLPHLLLICNVEGGFRYPGWLIFPIALFSGWVGGVIGRKLMS